MVQYSWVTWIPDWTLFVVDFFFDVQAVTALLFLAPVYNHADQFEFLSYDLNIMVL